MNKMNFVANIFTLAEKDCFWNVLFNAMGWKPKPTHDILDFHDKYDSEQPTKILRKFCAGGGRLRIRHLFKPLAQPSEERYMRMYYDDAFLLLRLIFSFEGGFPLTWNFDLCDEETIKELSFLSRQSPPLYDRLMKQFATQFREALHERILDAVHTELDDFRIVHYGASCSSFLILISPSMDEVFAYADATPEEIEMSAFSGWSMDSIEDIKETSSLADKHSKLIADGILAPFLN